jgi:hypothetical protein
MKFSRIGRRLWRRPTPRGGRERDRREFYYINADKTKSANVQHHVKSLFP